MNDVFRALARRNSGPTGILTAFDGVSTIEFAVIASMLATLAIGILDFGMGLWQQMEVGNAARAGAEYASINGMNNAGIRSAVTSASSLSSISASPAPSEQCGCPSASAVTFFSPAQSPPCNTSICANGSTPNTYILVSAQATYTPVVPFLGFSTGTLTATALARL
jgi:Flp pilus assembly protein TadG